MLCDIKQLFTMKTLLILANIAFTVILAVQLSHVLEGYFKPTTTRTWEEEVPLKDIDFPLVIKVCVIPGFNQSALIEMGYDNTWRYFLGLSRFNHSMFGWAGHTKDLRTIGSVEEVLAHVTDSRMKNILDSMFLSVIDEGGGESGPLQKQTKRVRYPNNCQSLSLSNIKHVHIIVLKLSGLGNYSVEVHSTGDSLDTGRRIKEHSSQSTGDIIKYNGKEGMVRSYMVDIAQRFFVEEDPNNNCRNYPNQDHQSYQECDDKFVRNFLPGGLTPIWITDDFTEVSMQVFYEKGTPERYKLKQLYEKLTDGDLRSDCPLPCKTTKTQTKFLDELEGEFTGFFISFSSTVRVTKTDLVRPSISSFLSEVVSKFKNRLKSRF